MQTKLVQKIAFALLLACMTTAELLAQAVPQTTIVEHFTNTLCGVCSSRNPGFYINLRQQTNTLHLAFHPSSPYSTCVFSQQNPAQNDARTNYYGVYGGTPRLVINGTAIPANQSYNASALFTPYQGLTSPFALQTTIAPKGADSITATVVLTTRAVHNHTALNLYIALAQDTVFYAAPNGEQQHYDVFRQSFTGSNALSVVPSSMIGGTVTIRKTIYKNTIWTANRLYAIANLQTTAKASLQAAASARFSTTTATENKAFAQKINVYPNPTSTVLFIDNNKNTDIRSVFIFNSIGQQTNAEWLADGSISVADLPKGVYFLRAANEKGEAFVAKFVKE
jgi:Secretion system C-terminal sorting domain